MPRSGYACAPSGASQSAKAPITAGYFVVPLQVPKQSSVIVVAVPGTPLQDRPPIDPLDLVRMVATARLLMPQSRVRLSAGRRSLSREAQVLCFLAGANSIFYGDKLLTTANNDVSDDLELIEEAGLSIEPANSSA